MCESTMKYFSPLCSYKAPPSSSLCSGGVYTPLSATTCLKQMRNTCFSRAARGEVPPAPRSGLSDWLPTGGEAGVHVRGCVLRVREHDRPVIEVDHPAVVRRHVLLELRGVVVAGLLAERLGDVVVDEVHPADRVDPDHRRKPHDRHIVQLIHDLGHDGADLVVHQGDTGPVRGRVVGLVAALGVLVGGHWLSSFGASRFRSFRMPAKRLLAASTPSSKRGGLASGCDHSGCSVREAAMARLVQVDSQPFRISLLWSANSRALVSRGNIG